jgi:3',5'-cyclic AMP phosphodiesterase CpdA
MWLTQSLARPARQHLSRLGLGVVCLVAGLSAQTASPALPSRTAPFFFLQMSDPQFGMFTSDRDFEQETVNFEMAIATANRLKPAFVIVTGDLVNKAGDPAQIAEYRRIATRLNPAIPLYQVPGNHDVENTPTPETIAAYERIFGPDHYTFTYEGFVGIVLDSTLIHTPDNVPDRYTAQDRWLRDQLTRAHRSDVRHIVIFQHHPWFLATAIEPDQYFNIPLVRRTPLLALFHEHGVKYLVSGHYHRNAIATDGDLTNVTTGSVGKPLGENPQSGLRVFVVNDGGISHRFYGLSELPNQIDPTKALAERGSH